MKALKVIKSCKHTYQLEVAERYVELAERSGEITKQERLDLESLILSMILKFQHEIEYGYESGDSLYLTV